MLIDWERFPYPVKILSKDLLLAKWIWRPILFSCHQIYCVRSSMCLIVFSHGYWDPATFHNVSQQSPTPQTADMICFLVSALHISEPAKCLICVWWSTIYLSLPGEKMITKRRTGVLHNSLFLPPSYIARWYKRGRYLEHRTRIPSHSFHVLRTLPSLIPAYDLQIHSPWSRDPSKVCSI